MVQKFLASSGHFNPKQAELATELGQRTSQCSWWKARQGYAVVLLASYL